MSQLYAETGWEHEGVPKEFINNRLEWAKNDLQEGEINDG